jgi:putative endonuclease
MTKTRQDLGRQGEQLAANKLQSSGFEIVARNYRCTAGEIDLVTRLGEVWVFVEVRTRRSWKYGTPEESITRSKKVHLIAAAQTYLQDQNLTNVDWRIDLVAIEINPKGQVLRMDIVENAVNAL